VRGGVLNLQGRKAFDMGVLGARYEIAPSGVINIDNATIGVFDSRFFVNPTFHAAGTGVCSITNSRARDMVLVTGSDKGVANARITASNVFTTGTLQQYPWPPNSIQVVRATPQQSFDLQNLDFEAGIQPTGVPDFWSASQVNGAVGAPRPGCHGSTRSYRYQAVAPGRSFKTLTLPEETVVQVFGSGQVSAAPSGAQLGLVVRALQSTTRRANLVNATPGWQRLQVPSFVVGPAAGPVTIEFGNSHSGVTDVLLDDLHVQLATWSDSFNLHNLDFEETNYRFVGQFPLYERRPDYWTLGGGAARAETVDLRPGTAGRAAVRVTVAELNSELFKDLPFVKAGDVLTVGGWLKCIPVPGPVSNLAVIISEGGFGNIKRIQIPVDSAWHSFQVQYTVPCPPAKQAFTRVDVHCFGSAGNVMLADDFTIRID
jgi:hypothetical protein